MGALASSPPGGTVPPCSDSSLARSWSAAATIEDPQQLMPEENPAEEAGGRAESPILSSTSSKLAPTASAAIWRRVVQVPVPMSAAAIETGEGPAGATRTDAPDPGRGKAPGQGEAAT